MPRQKSEIGLLAALIPFFVMIATMVAAVIAFDSAPHIPLAIGALVAGGVAWCHGYAWHEIEQALYEGIKQILPALVILMLLGLLISAWVAGGLVSAMIFYGLKLLSPAYFLPLLVLVCAIATLMTGSSWSTVGTLGVVGLGMGTHMGFSPEPVVGAIISGAYFGDKMSPLSDTTVLAAGVAEVDIFVHIRHMLYTAIPGLLIALAFFSFFNGQTETLRGQGQIDDILTTINNTTMISPWLLLMPLIVPLLAIARIPAIPALVVAIIVGCLAYLGLQGGTLGQLTQILQTGYHARTHNSQVDELLSQGGLEAMMYTLSLTVMAMCFGGIMEHTGMLARIVQSITRLARRGRGLCASVVTSSLVTNILTAEQYISIIIPGRMYIHAFKDKSIRPENLSRALEDGGTVTSALVPWSTGAVYIYSVLHVSAWSYAPYAVFNYAVVLVSLLLSLTGLTIARSNKPSGAPRLSSSIDQA